MQIKTFARILAAVAVLVTSAIFVNAQVSADRVWTVVDESQIAARTAERQIVPRAYRTFGLNHAALRAILAGAPEEFSETSRFVQTILTVPMPDGKYERFRIEHSLIVEPGLLEKFPDLYHTYNGRGIDNPNATIRLDLMPHGFHAMILSDRPTVYVDPYAKGDTDNYISYQKTALSRERGFYCGFEEENPDVFGILGKDGLVSNPLGDNVTNGSQLRTYRLALAATWEYTNVFGTAASATAAMVTSMNRVNGLYEKDLAIRMVIVANNNLLVFAGNTTNCGGGACNSGNDGYTNDDGIAMLGENQTKLDTVIGTANYDVGHVFSTGGGGVASQGPCNGGSKARGVTGLPFPVGDGFDIDFVAHEMGHQFGAAHTFNSSCFGNRSASAAYEPGSGITIMGYAGVCGSSDLAGHSIDTFHVKSLEQIVAFREGTGACGPATATGNTPPAVSIVGPTSYNIPRGTPFTLTAAATDVNGDSITYDWQEYDLGSQSPPHNDADGLARPLFRAYLPLTTGSRTYPSLPYILGNANVPPATTGGFVTGEILPSITRTMVFQVIARDNRTNGGGINTASITLNVTNTSGPFAVTAPNTGVTWTGNTSQTVTWNVTNTTAAPVSAANVKISFSSDGGNTFPTTILASTPNDGSELITVPNIATSQARIKVEGVGNIFFDVSDANFTVNAGVSSVDSPFDFDGDNKSDLSIFRPSNGQWWWFRSSNGQTFAATFGVGTDRIVPADYTGDSTTDIAFWRPSTGEWFVLRSENFTFYSAPFGTTGDTPVPDDYDGDTKADLAVHRPSTNTWFILKSAGGTDIIPFGSAGDKPVVGNYDGDNKADIAIFRPSVGQWWIRRSSDLSTFVATFGVSTDRPVQGRYTLDNKTDIAFWRPSTGTWFILRSEDFSFYSVPFGTSTDVPTPGDYDGDGRFDTAVFRPSTANWFVDRTTAGTLIQQFGQTTDTAVPSAYVP